MQHSSGLSCERPLSPTAPASASPGGVAWSAAAAQRQQQHGRRGRLRGVAVCRATRPARSGLAARPWHQGRVAMCALISRREAIRRRSMVQAMAALGWGGQHAAPTGNEA